MYICITRMFPVSCLRCNIDLYCFISNSIYIYTMYRLNDKISGYSSLEHLLVIAQRPAKYYLDINNSHCKAINQAVAAFYITPYWRHRAYNHLKVHWTSIFTEVQTYRCYFSGAASCAAFKCDKRRQLIGFRFYLF